MFTSAYTMPAGGALLREPLPPVPEQTVADLWVSEARRDPSFTSLQGNLVTVLNPGTLNIFDGPDFHSAIIEIDGEKLSGPVEIHLRLEDWYRHNHQNNSLYDGVVLHVILYPPEGLPPESLPPTVALASRLTTNERRNLTLGGKDLRAFEGCRSGDIRSKALQKTVLALAAETRFLRKKHRAAARFIDLSRSLGPAAAWSQCLYELLARSLGYGGNADGMQQLAERLPLAVLRMEARRGRNPSVLLDAAAASMHWHTKSVRPENRAEARLSQLRMLLPALLGPGTSETVAGEIRASGAGTDVPVLERWSPDAAKIIGRERCREADVNVFAAWGAAYGEMYRLPELEQAAVRMYFETPSPPRNRHTRAWCAHFGTPEPFTSGIQQGIIEMRTNMCAASKCASCMLAHPAVED